MRILGIDPGYAIVGFGIVEFEKNHFTPVDYGAITSPAGVEMPQRLKMIYDDMMYILEKYKPEEVSIEQLFFNSNTTTAMGVSQARGVILLSCANCGVPVFEYTPLQIKQAVTGYGRANKPQVQQMVQQILKLKEVPKPDDTADALAISICHAHSRKMRKIGK